MPGVDYIFHAVTLMQVHSCEFFPMQAVQTNVIGTDNALHAVIANHVKRVVCLSTDKGAYPIDAMGISKAMIEHVIYADACIAAEQGDTGTNIIGTRHGEKLYETLMIREESVRSEDMGRYFRMAADNRDLNYDKFVVKGGVHTMTLDRRG